MDPSHIAKAAENQHRDSGVLQYVIHLYVLSGPVAFHFEQVGLHCVGRVDTTAMKRLVPDFSLAQQLSNLFFKQLRQFSNISGQSRQ